MGTPAEAIRTPPNEDHVRHRGRAVRIPQFLRRLLNRRLGANQAYNVSPIQTGLGGNGNLLPGPRELSQEHPMGKFESGQFRQRLSDHGPLCNHHIQCFDRGVEERLVVYFRTERGPVSHMHLLPGDDRNHIVLMNDLANNLQQSWRFDWEPPKGDFKGCLDD